MSHALARRLIQVIAVLGVLFLLSQFIVYVVDQREQVVILRFGKPVQARTEPGLYFKVPFIDSVRRLPTTLQFWGDDEREVMRDLPTRDNKKIEVVPWAVWRINDPIAFVQRTRTMKTGEDRVSQFVRGAIRDTITQYDLEDLVRSTTREMKIIRLDSEYADSLNVVEAEEIESQPKESGLVGREQIMRQVNALAKRTLSAKDEGSRGVELVELGISHIDFVETVRRTTFERWKAERDAISTRNVTEGEQAKQEILNRTNAEIERIRGEGQRKASEIRGQADASVIQKYAEAIQEVGEFYTFVRTLEAYEKSMTADTELILTTQNDFLRLLQEKGVPQLSTESGVKAPAAEISQ